MATNEEVAENIKNAIIHELFDNHRMHERFLNVLGGGGVVDSELALHINSTPEGEVVAHALHQRYTTPHQGATYGRYHEGPGGINPAGQMISDNAYSRSYELVQDPNPTVYAAGPPQGFRNPFAVNQDGVVQFGPDGGLSPSTEEMLRAMGYPGHENVELPREEAPPAIEINEVELG